MSIRLSIRRHRLSSLASGATPGTWEMNGHGDLVAGDEIVVSGVIYSADEDLICVAPQLVRMLLDVHAALDEVGAPGGDDLAQRVADAVLPLRAALADVHVALDEAGVALVAAPAAERVRMALRGPLVAPAPAPHKPITSETLSDLLSLVGFDVGAPELDTWTPDERREAEDYAAALHLAASDHDDVDVPVIPTCLQGRPVWGKPPGVEDEDEDLGDTCPACGDDTDGQGWCRTPGCTNERPGPRGLAHPDAAAAADTAELLADRIRAQLPGLRVEVMATGCPTYVAVTIPLWSVNPREDWPDGEVQEDPVVASLAVYPALVKFGDDDEVGDALLDAADFQAVTDRLRTQARLDLDVATTAICRARERLQEVRRMPWAGKVGDDSGPTGREWLVYTGDGWDSYGSYAEARCAFDAEVDLLRDSADDESDDDDDRPCKVGGWDYYAELHVIEVPPPTAAAPAATPAPPPVVPLAPTRTGVRIDAAGVLGRIADAARALREMTTDGDERRSPDADEVDAFIDQHRTSLDPWMIDTLRSCVTELGQRFYAGDLAVVDEFLQLWCLDASRPQAVR